MRISTLGAAVAMIFFTSVLSEAQERQTLELRIFGICPVCESDVKSRILSVSGVAEANVDVVRKRVFVILNPDVNEAKIASALRQGGYETRRLFNERSMEMVALEISGIRDKDNITEIERTLYAFYDVDRVEISRRSNNVIATIDFRKGGLDQGQLIMYLKDSLPEAGVEIIPRGRMLEAQVGKQLR